MLRTKETYDYTHVLASYRVIKGHSIRSAWPHAFHSEDVHPFPFFPKDGPSDKLLDWVLAYDHRWPITYSPELETRLGHTTEEMDQAMKNFIQHPRDGFPAESQHLNLPFAPFITVEALNRLLETNNKLYGLTFAGSNIFSAVETYEIVNNNLHGLVYLNLLSCDIPPEGLNFIRNMRNLDTFIHETTLFPGLAGVIPPEVQGTRRSLKINLTYVTDTSRLPVEKLANMVAEYNFIRDRSILFRRGLHAHETAAQHPFMGPLSAANCLKELVTVLSDSEFSRHWSNSPSLLNGIFSKGYRPEIQAGLSVTMSPDPWEDYENDDGTRLMVSCWAGNIHACFSEWITDSQGQRTLGKFTAYDYLARFMNLLEPGDITEKCEELRTWFGVGYEMPKYYDGIRSPGGDLSHPQAKMEEMELQSEHEVSNVSEGIVVEYASSLEDSGDDSDTEIEDI